MHALARAEMPIFLISGFPCIEKGCSATKHRQKVRLTKTPAPMEPFCAKKSYFCDFWTKGLGQRPDLAEGVTWPKALSQALLARGRINSKPTVNAYPLTDLSVGAYLLAKLLKILLNVNFFVKTFKLSHNDVSQALDVRFG